MLCMLAQGTISFFVTLMIQYKVFLRIQRFLSALIFGPENIKSNLNSEEQDEDVKNETDRILQDSKLLGSEKDTENVLIVQELSKRYKR